MDESRRHMKNIASEVDFDSALMVLASRLLLSISRFDDR